MGLKEEIFEQPQVLRDLIENQYDNILDIASALKNRNIEFLFLAARGTSDNAGLYAKYLYGIHNHLPIALAAPSIFSVYQMPPRISNSLVMGVSQSGQSPDIVSVLTEGRAQGAVTLAITNQPDSPLGQAAEFIIDISAGEEKAVAATKTYTAQLMSIALLSVALSGDSARLEQLKQVPGYVEQALALEHLIKETVERFYYMRQCVILGRGYNYSTAFEWALKLKELTYVVAQPYSSADFMHGPIAIVDQGFPIMSVIPKGAVSDEMIQLAQKLKQELQAELILVSNCTEAMDLGGTMLKLPEKMPEWVSPMVSIIPAQLFCYHLTRIKGFDAQKPRGLKKVTETR